MNFSKKCFSSIFVIASFAGMSLATAQVPTMEFMRDEPVGDGVRSTAYYSLSIELGESNYSEPVDTMLISGHGYHEFRGVAVVNCESSEVSWDFAVHDNSLIDVYDEESLSMAIPEGLLSAIQETSSANGHCGSGQ